MKEDVRTNYDGLSSSLSRTKSTVEKSKGGGERLPRSKDDWRVVKQREESHLRKKTRGESSRAAERYRVAVVATGNGNK